MPTDLSLADLLLTLGLGVGLAAAAGLRIFLPLLVVSIASLSGHLVLTPGFAWLGTVPAALVLGVASLVEIGAYYVPWLDNLLDVLGAPVALVAGTMLTASVLTDLDPLLRWSLAVIAGGGAAGAVHTSLALVRKASSLATGGLGNPLVSTAEAGGSVLLAVAALAAPVLALVLLALGVVAVVRLVRRRHACA